MTKSDIKKKLKENGFQRVRKAQIYYWLDLDCEDGEESLYIEMAFSHDEDAQNYTDYDCRILLDPIAIGAKAKVAWGYEDLTAKQVKELENWGKWLQSTFCCEVYILREVIHI